MPIQDKNDTSENFSLRLLETMKRKGLKQQDLADFAHLSRGAVSKYLRGDTLPKSLELYKISKVLGVTMEWLLDGRDSSDNSNPNDAIYWEKIANDQRIKLEFAAQALSGIVDKLRN